MDVFSKKKRSKIMAAIKSGDTKPELAVRSILRHLGYRFRIHDKKLPGKPDIVLPRLKKVIFVHGCFWHRHKNCKRSELPQTNRLFWKRKIAGNAARDRVVKQRLHKIGWRELTVWQCQTKNLSNVKKRLSLFIKE